MRRSSVTGGRRGQDAEIRLSGKEGAKDVPSWAKGTRPLTTENGRQFATRLLDAKYGKGNYPTGPGSEFSKIKKWGDRAFECSDE